jgi:very-short-patch-repair endonuclease
LDVCISHFHPVRTLRWHYRSQHESLIAFSNQNFYRGNLVVFPSPFGKSKELGLRYHYVKNGIYEGQMNVIEARQVVEAVASHIQMRPGNSLGVVTLNVKQRELISEMLEERLKTVSGADDFKMHWKSHGMELFVKNLENVQGDERDCIIISTTFGRPATAGVVRQNFGPISRGGGWRRLNVLFTRAKKSVVVFSSMRPEDIVVDKSTPEGTKALRNYLLFARDNILTQNEETDLPPDSDFEVAILDLLKVKGYEVVPQLGVAGFRIDIAVRHPDYKSVFLAAIECDGASYHSGVSVRDRDRIRQEILEGLGWRGRIWRIWSTDWFRNPHTEAQRLFSFLEVLRAIPIPAGESYDDVIEDIADSALPTAEDIPTSDVELSEIVLETADDEIEVRVGDLVTYFNIESPDAHLSVKITSMLTNVNQGLIGEGTPLAQVLLGSTAGDEVVLRVPGKAPATLRVHEIYRKETEEPELS